MIVMVDSRRIDRAVNIGIAEYRQVSFQTPFERVGIKSAVVDDLDSVYELLLKEPGVNIEPDPPAVSRLPVRMVPEDKRLLPIGGLDRQKKLLVYGSLPFGLGLAFGVKCINRVEKQRVIMTRRHTARDLGGLDQQNIAITRLASCNLIRTFVVRWNVILVRLVLDVIGDSYGIQAVSPRLVHPDCRPDSAVGENRMHVEITLERLVAGDIRDADLVSLPGGKR